MFKRSVFGKGSSSIGRGALVLLMLITASCGTHRITSTPSDASVYLRGNFPEAKPKPEDMILMEKRTPYVLRSASAHWYQVRKNNHADSEIIFLPSNVWSGTISHHFDLKPLFSAQPASAVPARASVILAVFDIEDATEQLKEQEILQIQEFFEARLTELGDFKIIPREQLRKRLLKEKTNSYRDCFDEACQIELGKEVAAEKSLSTRILKVGSTCVVTSKLFDLKTATSEKAATAHVACNPEALLEGMGQLATQLSAP